MAACLRATTGVAKAERRRRRQVRSATSPRWPPMRGGNNGTPATPTPLRTGVLRPSTTCRRHGWLLCLVTRACGAQWAAAAQPKAATQRQSVGDKREGAAREGVERGEERDRTRGETRRSGRKGGGKNTAISNQTNNTAGAVARTHAKHAGQRKNAATPRLLCPSPPLFLPFLPTFPLPFFFHACTLQRRFHFCRCLCWYCNMVCVIK